MTRPQKHCRQCGRPYLEEDNTDAACSYHPGRLLDYDKIGQPGMGCEGDFWECCNARISDQADPLARPCATGRHVEAPRGDPGPIQRELDAQAKIAAEISARFASPSKEATDLARRRVRRFLAGQVDYPGYSESEPDGLPGDVRILERTDLGWLLDRARDASCPVEKRRLLAQHLRDPGKAAQVRQAVE